MICCTSLQEKLSAVAIFVAELDRVLEGKTSQNRQMQGAESVNFRTVRTPLFHSFMKMPAKKLFFTKTYFKLYINEGCLEKRSLMASLLRSYSRLD